MSEENQSIETEVVDEAKGGFLQGSLKRSNRQIREERGEAIAEDLEIVYRRKVEDLETEVKRGVTRQKNAFDFSPTNSQSLVMAKELESVDILDKDLKLGEDLRALKIRLNIAKERYNFLFGHNYELETIV